MPENKNQSLYVQSPEKHSQLRRKNSGWRRKKKLILPNFKSDVLDLFEPVKVKTRNDVIFECEEKEEADEKKDLKKDLLFLRNKREKVYSVMSQLRKSAEIKFRLKGEYSPRKSDDSLLGKKTRSIIFENQDEYYFDE